MPQTITQKILAKACGKRQVKPGDQIEIKLDLTMTNDVNAPLAIEAFEKSGSKSVFDADKVLFVMDHFSPAKDVDSAEQIKLSRNFAKKYDLTYFFDVGQMGIEHVLLPEKGFVKPGDCITGGDSHACTYGALGAFSTGIGSTDFAYGMATGKFKLKVPETIKVELTGKPKKWVSGKDVILYLIGKIGVKGALDQAIEFSGPGIRNLGIDDRFTIANMVVEAGAVNGIFPVDEVTKDYLEGKVKEKYQVFEPDKDAHYRKTIKINLGLLEPQVAFPSLPENTKPISKIKQRIRIDQVVLCSCTNARLSDLRVAASILKGKEVAKGIRFIVVPATQMIYKQAIKEGLIDVFIDAGCAVSTPTCGPCAGLYMGVLASKEVCLSTGSRNFVGRMGHTQAKIYLSSPAVAAASGVKGYISRP